ncbi:MAG: ABC-F type ribosomal protection protein [Oscillospiraceae bacterium]
MSLIQINNLSFTHDSAGEPLFKNVSLSLDTDWRLGLTGRNGRGKTTLLKLLCGEYDCDGSITASVECAYFPYEIAASSRETREVLRTAAPDAMDWEIERELSLLDVGEEVLTRPFETLSGGERTKVLLAALFLGEHRFLLIDEPTNHLDTDGRAAVSAYLKRKSGFILVSHDRAFLDGCVDHILSINRADITVQRGNFSTWLADKERRDRFELDQNEKLKKEISHLTQAARRTAAWSDRAERSKIGFDPSKVEKSTSRRPYEGAKSKKLMARASAIETRQEAAIAEKSGLLKNLEQNAPLKIAPLTYHTKRLVTLEDISIAYDMRTVCEHVSFSVNAGERIALAGKNGCGKTSVLKLLCGADVPHTGSVLRGTQLKISYVSQTTDALAGSLTGYAEETGIDLSLFFAILRKLDFPKAQLDRPMELFSAGQKKKALLARSLCARAHLYVWDEPLNFIDVLSRMQLEQLLTEHQPTMIFVEHDRAFREKIATRTVQL